MEGSLKGVDAAVAMIPCAYFSTTDLQHGVHVADDQGRRWSWSACHLQPPRYMHVVPPPHSYLAAHQLPRLGSRSGERVNSPPRVSIGARARSPPECSSNL